MLDTAPMRAESLSFQAGEPAGWDPELDDTLLCRQVRDETHDVKTFVLEAPSPRLFRFQPGQFLTFEFEIDGVPVSRCYTIASSPTRPHLVSITVKRVPGGEVTPWLHRMVGPGKRLRVAGPMGSFTCTGHVAPGYLFLSGGSGITPLMSMARFHDDMASGADIVFVHSARSPADIIFRSELHLMAEHHPGFRFVPVCETDSLRDPWHGLRGRLSPAMLAVVAPDFREREVFTCGPAGYMAVVRAMLSEAGFDMARYHEESFDFAALAAAEPDAAAVAHAAVQPASFRIEFARSKTVLECAPGASVLEAARAKGMRLPSSCTRGVCGTCKSRILSGRVDMQHGGGIRQREIDQGMALLCCSRPLTDLVIDR